MTAQGLFRIDFDAETADQRPNLSGGPTFGDVKHASGDRLRPRHVQMRGPLGDHPGATEIDATLFEGGATYRVGLEDARTGERVPSPDPFAVYLGRVLAACRRRASAGDDEVASAATNLRLMARCADALRAAGHWTPTPA